MDGRAAPEVLLRHGLRDKALRGHVQAPRRRVHELGARHHGVGVHLRQAPVHVDREDREHVEPGVDLRPPHRLAAGGGAGALVAGQPVRDCGVREPPAQTRAQRGLALRTGRVGHDHARDRPGQARAHEEPADSLDADHGHVRGVAHVQFSQERDLVALERLRQRPLDPDPAGPVLRHDEQTLAMQQQLVRIAVERKRVEQARSGGVDRVELAARDREDPPVSRFHHVGLVDPLLLDVCLRLIRLGAGSGGSRHRPHRRRVDHPWRRRNDPAHRWWEHPRPAAHVPPPVPNKRSA